jgi:SsrA-binding protein
MAKKELSSSISRNKRALFDYEIIEKLEAGLVLIGCEVKSIREGNISLRDTYARAIGNEIYLIGCYIAPYKEGSYQNADPSRDRKILLHKKELSKWSSKVREKGFTIVPISMYFKDNKVKLKLGLGRSKKLHDKRHALKEKDTKRELDRARKHF